MSYITVSLESGDLKLFDFCFQLVLLRSVRRIKAFKPNLIAFSTERHGEVAEMALTQVWECSLLRNSLQLCRIYQTNI